MGTTRHRTIWLTPDYHRALLYRPSYFSSSTPNSVQNVINRHQGSMVFVDDYSAWVIGSTAEDNWRKIKERIIPRAEVWEAGSGATFEPIKATFVHFTRNTRKLSDTPLVIRDQQVRPQPLAKIFGVVLDQQLRDQNATHASPNEGFALSWP